MKPTAGRDLSSLFNGASGPHTGGSGNDGARNRKAGQGVIGGFDDNIQRRKDCSVTATSPKLQSSTSTRDHDKKIESNLQSILYGGVSAKKSTNKMNKATTKSSRGGYDFLREWRQQCKNPQSTLLFLTRMKSSSETLEEHLVLNPEDTCKQFFSTDIDSAIVGDIIDAMHLLMIITNGSDEDLLHQNSLLSASSLDGHSSLCNISSSEKNFRVFARKWLKALNSCGRFDLSISFLIPEQQMKLKDLCSYLSNARENEDGLDDFLLRYENLLEKL